MSGQPNRAKVIYVQPGESRLVKTSGNSDGAPGVTVTNDTPERIQVTVRWREEN